MLTTHKQWHNPSSTTNNHSNMVSPKQNNNSSETKLKMMEDCDQNDTEFNTVVMKQLN